MKLFKDFLVIVFIPITLFLKIISPIIKVRWSKVYFPDRIGHLVAELEHYLHLTKNKSFFCLDLFPKDIFINNKPCNSFLQKHYRDKVIKVDRKIITLLQRSQKIIERFIKILKSHNIDQLLSTRDNFRIFDKNFKPSIKFSKPEKKIIKKELYKIGLKKNQKFVCLIVRDAKYLNNRLNFDTTYHNYRDCNVQNFKKGIKYLLDKGFFVFRMGKLQDEKLHFKNKNFLDYAFSKYRSDLMDVWLMSNCNFCISTGTGLDQIARVFKRPTLLINHLPIVEWSSHFKSLTHPKFLFNVNKKRYLNLKEYIKHSYYRKKQYDKNFIKIIELNDKQVLDCIKEFLLLLNTNWKISEQKRKNQFNLNRFFKKYLKEHHPNIDFHKNIHKHALISSNFLKKTKLISRKDI